MKAYWRDDYMEEGIYPHCSKHLSHDEWCEFYFEVLENPCSDFITDEGFNMLLQHPLTKETLFVDSSAFNFKEWHK